MKLWKQLTICLLIIIAAGAGWFVYKNKQAGTDTAPAAANAQGSGSRQGGSGGGQRGATLVVTEPARSDIVNGRLEAIGSLRAFQTVSVTPYTSGTLMKLKVKAGEVLKAGDVIAELDAESEEIILAKAKTVLKDLENTLERIVRLRKTNTATQVQEVTAELAVANARLTVQDAELALSRRTVKAPIAGTVGILPVDAGNYVTAQTVLARLDDTSKVLIDIYVPERFVPQIKTGQKIQAESTALPGQTYNGHIIEVDNMLDEASRTMRVRGMFENPRNQLLAGMSFTTTMLFPGDEYASVSPLSIQWGAEGAYVWRVRDDKAEQVPVTIVQRNSASVLVNGAINVGDVIVTEGVQALRNGMQVRIKNAAANKAPKAD
ncbi:RND family efflux transporter MFP subunit [Paenochrobactrum gallinarii]|uniref:RND family efflux transporter MFP subunit n=1 Tax=Paenochrobactrum gallinarii TaxID=643673 RepID=A0A841LRC4_9HYPH|nr:efflux RND transporter periplasmic adaptor subunit [Paenochrobactrum gallinarii]MBB6260655.1 RND family efflux transporter MFP subunit [Paenochrobactrum gallinarii]